MMVLKDGPAKGAYAVRRAPYHLRAVVDEKTGETDVLDQLGDYPKGSERIHVYRCVKNDGGIVSVMLAGKNGRGRRCVQSVSAEYEYLPDVDGEPFRDQEAWRAWAIANAPEGVEPLPTEVRAQ